MHDEPPPFSTQAQHVLWGHTNYSAQLHTTVRVTTVRVVMQL